MPDYGAMYQRLFRSQTKAIDILQKAQQETEEMYINAPEPTLIVMRENLEDTDAEEERP